MEGITTGEAFARLKEMYPELQGGAANPGPTKKVDRVRPFPENATAPPEQWQERAAQVMAAATKRLWGEEGRPGREYLLSRGITEETMRVAQLGYIPQDVRDFPEEWGIADKSIESVFIPRGILFPYIYKGDIWKLQIRRIDPEVQKGKRYPVVNGSANGLYRADALKVDHPALLFEGPINALSAAQAIGDLAACVATGGATQARIDQWKMRLALTSQVLLCFDGDEAGQEAVTYWHKRLGELAAYLSASGEACKDANDMLRAGVDLVSWVTARLVVPNGTNDTKSGPGPGNQIQESSLAMPILPTVAPSKRPRPAWAYSNRNDRGLLITCSQCLNDAVWWGAGCTPFCDKCWSGDRHEREVH